MFVAEFLTSFILHKQSFAINEAIPSKHPTAKEATTKEVQSLIRLH